MKLSENFTLEEFLRSQTAARHGIDMTPADWVLENLQRLVEGCLQPLRDHVKASVNVSSGYRPEELNNLIGGSKSSQHRNGNACDFTITGWPPYETAQLIVELELPFDQVIHEFGQWVHLGTADILRGEKLTAYKEGTKTRYTRGILRMDELT